MPDPKPQLTLTIYFPSDQEHVFYLGPHSPHLTPKDIDVLHGIWLELSEEVSPEELHHHDIVHFALDELRHDLDGSKRSEIVAGLRRHLRAINGRRVRQIS